MSYSETRAKISLLQDSRAKLMAKGGMTREKREILDDLDSTIESYQRELPANTPLSLQGPSGKSRTSAVSDTGPYATFGDQLQDIAQAGNPSGKVNPRLHSIRASSGLNESVPSDGGFLVQQDFSGELIKRIFSDPTSILPRLTRVQISGNANSIDFPMVDETSRATGSRLGGVQTYWTGEGVAGTPSAPKFRKLHLDLNKLMGICYATDELLADAALLEFVVQNGFASELAFTLQDCVINGSGAGQPLGLLNSGALVTVGKETGQAADTFVLENVVKMWERLPGRNRANAVWLINSSVESQLYTMSLSVGTGGSPVFLPGGSASPTPFMTLFGRPILPIEQCPALGDLGDVILCDPSEYIFVDKGGAKYESSIHVRFLWDEMTFRVTYRCDGQPMAAAPTASFKGAVDQSPFIVLQAR